MLGYYRTWLVVVFSSGLVTGTCQAAAPPANIIFDSDLDHDCDGIGALFLLHGAVQRGEVKLLATIGCTSTDEIAPCLDAISTWSGRPENPRGTLKDKGYLDHKGFSAGIAKRYPCKFSSGKNYPDATYRRTLANEADDSVMIVKVGPLRNIANLLKSKPDDASPLDGTGHVAMKVKRLEAVTANDANEGVRIATVELNEAIDSRPEAAVSKAAPGDFEMSTRLVSLSRNVGGPNAYPADNRPPNASGAAPAATEPMPTLAETVQSIDAVLVEQKQPWPDAVRAKVENAREKADDAALHRALADEVFLTVQINPEGRVKVQPGPAPAPLIVGQPKTFLLKIENGSGGQQTLTPIGTYTGAAKNPFRLAIPRTSEVEPRLVGLAVEYRLLTVECSDSGAHELTISISAGQGTQDLGFRAEAPVLFRVTARPK